MKDFLASLLPSGVGGVGTDPTDPYGTNAAARQRKIADALRKSSEKTATGRMVGPHYVAPSWTQHLGDFANTVGGAYMSNQADKSEAASRGVLQQAKEKWLNSMPEGTPEQAGPIDVNNPTELDAQTPTLGKVLKHALSGVDIPGNEKNAQLYATMAGKEIDREDTQKERKQTAVFQRVEAQRKQAADIEARKEAAKDKAEQISRENERDRENRRALAQMSIDGRIQAANIAAAARGSAPPKPVPHQIMKELSTASDQLDNTKRLVGEFKPDYAGLEGTISSAVGSLPFVNTEAKEWWRNYRRDAEMIERHGLFGATFTPSEKAVWDSADINPNMDPDEVQRRLVRRQTVMDKHFKSRTTNYIRGGHAGVAEMFPEVANGTTPPVDKPATPVNPALPRGNGGAGGIGSGNVVDFNNYPGR